MGVLLGGQQAFEVIFPKYAGRVLQNPGRLHIGHGRRLDLALSQRPFEGGLELSVTVVGGCGLPLEQETADEALHILTSDVGNIRRHAIIDEIAVELPGGAGVGYQGRRTQVLGPGV